MFVQVKNTRFFRRFVRVACFPLLRKVRRFEGVHKGETCFIFGDGPSIKYFDLSRFTEHVGIAVNRLHLHVDFDKLNVQYYLHVEPFALWPRLQRGPFHTRADRNKWRRLLVPTSARQAKLHSIYSIASFPWVPSRRQKLFVFDRLPSLRSAAFKETAEPFRGSFRAALSWAAYLGFTRAYLIGFDSQHYPPIQGHWFTTKSGRFDPRLEQDKQYFHTMKGEMELFHIVPRRTSAFEHSILYEDFVGIPPKFRERDSLISGPNLAILGLHPHLESFAETKP